MLQHAGPTDSSTKLGIPMSHPQEDAIPMPGPSRQTKTLIYVEGHKTAAVISEGPKGFSERSIRMQSAEAALAWCKARTVKMIYLPTDPARN